MRSMVEGARLRELSQTCLVAQLKPGRGARACPLHRATRGPPPPRCTRGRMSPGHLVPYSVNTKSRPSTIVWQAKPHLASLPCGGWFASVPGANVLAAAS
jgi:hypothetical protein